MGRMTSPLYDERIRQIPVGSPLLGGAREDYVGFSAEDASATQIYKRRLEEIERDFGPKLQVSKDPTGGQGVRFGMHPAFREQISSLRGKLINVGERFVGFDKTMEELALMRKNAEYSRVDAMNEDLMKLERAINTEIRRRVDYSRTLQIVTENYANEMLDRLQKRLVKQMEHTIGALDSLSARCLTLERGILQFKGDLPSKLVVETTAIMRKVEDCKQQMKVWQKEIRADCSMEVMVGELEYKLDAQMETFYSHLDTEIEELHQGVKELAIRNVKDEKEFQNFVKDELSMVRKGVKLEEQARQRTDDEIVSAIHVYSNALQNGLRIANK